MAKSRAFQSGNSQAVRLPKEFRGNTKEVEIFRRGNDLILRENLRPMEQAFHLLANLPEGFMPGNRADTPLQLREDLD